MTVGDLGAVGEVYCGGHRIQRVYSGGLLAYQRPDPFPVLGGEFVHYREEDVTEAGATAAHGLPLHMDLIGTINRIATGGVDYLSGAHGVLDVVREPWPPDTGFAIWMLHDGIRGANALYNGPEIYTTGADSFTFSTSGSVVGSGGVFPTGRCRPRSARRPSPITARQAPRSRCATSAAGTTASTWGRPRGRTSATTPIRRHDLHHRRPPGPIGWHPARQCPLARRGSEDRRRLHGGGDRGAGDLCAQARRGYGMSALRRLLAEIATPTEGGGYAWAVIGIGHVMLGAALQGVLGAAGVVARLGLALAYWLAKERGDLRRGGTVRDGLVDAAFVGVGAFYTGPRWWPLAVLLTVAVGAWIREARR